MKKKKPKKNTVILNNVMVGKSLCHVEVCGRSVCDNGTAEKIQPR
jgi:hypothetical protein